jgi:DNA polymerase III gamma/tau subunit
MIRRKVTFSSEIHERRHSEFVATGLRYVAGRTDNMKLLIGTAILCMLATVPAYAGRQDQDNKQEAPKANDNRAAKPPAETKEPANKPAEKPIDHPAAAPKPTAKTESAPRHQQDQQQPQQQQKAEQKAQKNEEKAQQQQAKTRQKEEKNQQKQEVKGQPSQQPRGDQNQRQVASSASRGNERGHTIPEDRYRADFGRAHTFHVRHDNNRRFQFGGYWFEYTNAWPSDWGYDDDFYIVEIDGVDYLCDARFPDQRIVVVITT